MHPGTKCAEHTTSFHCTSRTDWTCLCDVTFPACLQCIHHLKLEVHFRNKMIQVFPRWATILKKMPFVFSKIIKIFKMAKKSRRVLVARSGIFDTTKMANNKKGEEVVLGIHQTRFVTPKGAKFHAWPHPGPWHGCMWGKCMIVDWWPKIIFYR